MLQNFTRIEQLSLQYSGESINDERPQAQRELEDIETILEAALAGLEVLYPERANELKRETQEESNLQLVAGPAAPTSLAMPTAHCHATNPQGATLVVSHDIRTERTLG